MGGGGGRGGLGGRGGGGGWGGEGGGGGQGGTTCMYITEIVPVIEHTNLAERYASYDNHDQVNRSRRQNRLAQVGPLRRIQVKKIYRTIISTSLIITVYKTRVRYEPGL